MISPRRFEFELETLEPRVLLSTFQVIAAGSVGEEQMELQIDGTAVQSWTVGGDADAGEFLSFNFSNAGTVSADDVRIAFTNDLYDPANNIDRNLRVDAIIIDGSRYETEDPSVFSTGTWKAEDGIVPGFREDEYLHTDGYFQYSSIVDPTDEGDVSLQSAVINVSEADTSAQLTIVRENGSAGIITVDYRTDAISATDGQDFTGVDGTVTFLNGETIKTIDVDLLDDILIEPNEQFSFTIDNVTGGANLLDPQTATITIADDDSPQTETIISITAAGETGNEDMDLLIDGVVVASWSSLGIVPQDYSYTASSTVTADQIRVAFTNDVFDEATNTDYNLIVDRITVDGIVYQTEDESVFSTGTWLPADGIVPGFRESEILHSDGYFQYATIVDPTDEGDVSLQSAVVNVSEADTSAQLTILRENGSAGIITVDFRTDPISATDGQDFTGVDGTVTFLDGETIKTIDVDLLNDVLPEPNEQFSFTIDNVTGGASLLDPQTATITIVDDDSPQTETVILITAAGETGNEDMDLLIDGVVVASWSGVGIVPQDYSYTASSTVTADQIRVAFTNDVFDEATNTDYNLIVDRITVGGIVYQTEDESVFSTGTWLPADGIVPGFRESEILHTNGYFQYSSIVDPSDFGDISLLSSVIDVSETDPSAQLTIVRENGSDGVITVDYRTVALSATDGQDFIGVDGTVTFLDGETIKTIDVDLLDDILIEPNEQFSFTIDNVTGGANLLVPRTATITIDDDDSIQAGGDGLLGEYFDKLGFAERFANRVDATVDFDWAAGAPVPGMGADTFSIRWSGKIEPLYDEAYTFHTNTDDGVRLWVDGQLIIDQWVDQTATVHTGTITLNSGQLYDIRMEVYEDTGNAVAQLSWSSVSQALEIIPQSQLYAADPPPGPGGDLVAEDLFTSLNAPTAIEFSADGTRMYISERRGTVLVAVEGSLNSQAVLDFRDRVNGTRDRGLLDIALHPDFENSPYLYLIYTYDPPETQSQTGLAAPDGLGNRAGRLTRVELDATTNYTTIVPNSEVVLVGNNSIWANFNGSVNSTNDFTVPPAGILPDGSNLQDFIATDSESHTVGSLEFGIDGALYASIGDGTSYNQVDARTVRVQDIDNLSGKILRIDPITGEGLIDNPFFDATDPNANRSKVYQYGLRNPFRITIHPTTGQVYIGEVGWTQWEEINAGAPGSNFGWPYFEGGSGESLQTGGYSALPEAQDFYASGEIPTPSIFALNHAADGINAIVVGDIYTGNAYPSQYQGDLFFNDLGQGIVRNVSFDAEGNILSIDNFTTGAEVVVDIKQGPDGHLYYVNFNESKIGRWVFTDQGANIAGAPSGDAPVTPPQTFNEKGAGITIAVIDSGTDLKHSQLATRLWNNSGEIAGDGIDNDDNGFVDDVHGYDFVDKDGSPTDRNGHGTAIAGLIAGANGIAPGANLMILRAMNGDGTGSTRAIADSIRYAVDHGAQIISIALESEPNSTIEAAMRHASLNNVLLVIAAGNDGAANPSWMARMSSQFENVVSVGATSHADGMLPESNLVGNSAAVQIDARGTAFTILPGEGYGTYRGTSVAVANVTGAAALALSVNSKLSAVQLRQVLIASADEAMAGSDSIGHLNIQKAIDLSRQSRKNVVRIARNRLILKSTAGDDNVLLSLEKPFVTINGVEYEFPDGSFNRIIIDGRDGNDKLTLVGTDGNEVAYARKGLARFRSEGLVTFGKRFEDVTFYGNGGKDRAVLQGSSGNETFESTADVARLSGDQFEIAVNSFGSVRVKGEGGNDQLIFNGTNERERLRLISNKLIVKGSSYSVKAIGFENIIANGSGSDSLVRIMDDRYDSQLQVLSDRVVMTGKTYKATFSDFAKTRAYSAVDQNNDFILYGDQPHQYNFAAIGDWQTRIA